MGRGAHLPHSESPTLLQADKPGADKCEMLNDDREASNDSSEALDARVLGVCSLMSLWLPTMGPALCRALLRCAAQAPTPCRLKPPAQSLPSLSHHLPLSVVW